MRKYQQIWEDIKSKGSCTIAAPREYHRRIIKAVMKERTEDTVYRVELEMKKHFARLTYKQDGSKIKFTVTVYPSIEEKIGAL